MGNCSTWNRSWIVIACVMAAAGASCTSAGNPMMPTAPMADGAAAAPVQRTAGAIDSIPLLGPDLAAVRRATARFHDTDVAAAAGYVFAEPCVESPAGAMGIHTPNPALIAMAGQLRRGEPDATAFWADVRRPDARTQSKHAVALGLSRLDLAAQSQRDVRAVESRNQL